MPRLIIDDQEIEVPPGTKVIEAAERLGIMIPRFCYHKALGAVGACRMCAVKFVQGPVKGLQMSCLVEAQDGMVVSTTDEEAVAFRKQVIEWLMLNHPHDCPVCDEGGQCLLQDETVSGGHGLRRYPGRKRTYRDQYLGELIAHEMNRCIHCYRCSRFYQEFAGYRDLGPMQIGNRVTFGRFKDGRLESPFSGNLLDICPTGVYTDKPSRYKVRRWDLTRSPSLCVHCSLGCNTTANARHRSVMRMEGRFNEAVNGFFICDRGRYGFAYSNGGSDRGARPRSPRVNGCDTGWHAALGAAADRIDGVAKQWGNQAVACIASPRGSLETLFVLKRLCREQKWEEPAYFESPSTVRKVKTVVSRLDDRLAVSLRRIEEADFVLAVGVDPLNEAPMLALAMRQASRNGAPVVVMDPRPVSLPLEFEHLPVHPTQMAACLSILIKTATEPTSMGVGGHKPPVLSLSSLDSAGLTGERMGDLGARLSRSRKPVIVCGLDVVPESLPALAAECALLLGRSKDEAGLFTVLPGANAFGAALLSPGVDRSLESVVLDMESGKVKALLIVESDPFHSYPDRQRLEKAFESLECLVVLDYLPTETVSRAHVFLPTTTLFEEGSTFINQEGRVQYSEPVQVCGAPLGGAHPERVYSRQVPQSDPRPSWRALQSLARARSLPLGELKDDDLRKAPAQEDPVLEAFARLPYPLDGIRVIPRGSPAPPFASCETAFKGDIQDETPGDSASPNSLDLLLVDRLFGTEELSLFSDILQPLEEAPCLCMQAQDAAVAGLADGNRVALVLDRGEMEITLCVKENMARGVLILPRHGRLHWQKIKGFSTSIPMDRIRKL